MVINVGLFDKKWIVEFEYCDSFIASYKKASIEVEASSEYSAKDKAKAVLKAQHKYLKILSAREAAGKNDKGTYKPTVTETKSTSYSSYGQTSAGYEEENLRREREALERERNALVREREKLEYERWYASLSDEEKEKEDRRKRDEEAERQRIFDELEASGGVHSENSEHTKAKLPVSFYVLVGVDSVLMLIPIALLIIFKIAEKSVQEGYDKAVQQGLKGLQAEYLESLNTIKGNCVFMIVLLVVFGLFTAISLFASYKKYRR